MEEQEPLSLYLDSMFTSDNRWTRKVGFSEKDKIVDENLIFLTVGGPQISLFM